MPKAQTHAGVPYTWIFRLPRDYVSIWWASEGTKPYFTHEFTIAEGYLPNLVAKSARHWFPEISFNTKTTTPALFNLTGHKPQPKKPFFTPSCIKCLSHQIITQTDTTQNCQEGLCCDRLEKTLWTVARPSKGPHGISFLCLGYAFLIKWVRILTSN